MNNLDQPIFVAGHRGLVGSAIIRRLHSGGYSNLLSAKHEELDLRNQQTVELWFKQNRPTQVYLVAGKVGGILANSTYPAQFIYDNRETVVQEKIKPVVAKKEKNSSTVVVSGGL